MEEIVKNPAETTSSKSGMQHIPMVEWILKMRMAFSNAKNPEIQEKVADFGYNNQKLTELLEKIDALEQLCQQKTKNYSEQHAKTSSVEEKRKEITETYMQHLAFCRILFKNNVKATSALEFNGVRKTQYSAWFQQVNNFYMQLLNTQEFLEQLKKINIKEDDLRAVITELNTLTSLKEAQKIDAAKAQSATNERDKAFEVIYNEYADFIGYAKVLFKNDQTLEALGIVVKNK